MVVPCLPKMDVYGRDFDVHSCVFSFSFSFFISGSIALKEVRAL